MADHKMLQLWKQDKVKSIKLVHPEWSEDKIIKYLDAVIDKKLQDPQCAIVNNYLHREVRSLTVLSLYDFIHDTKPIIAGGGVLFTNQEKALNPPSFFLDGSLTKRKNIKKELKKFKPGSYEYQMADLRQQTEKVVANSYYGASGNETSPFYNKYTALATTATGQSLISCMMTAFENFYANNTKFYDVDDFLLYIRNSLKKEYKKEVIEDMPDITYEALIRKFYDMYYKKSVVNKESTKRIMAAALSRLNPEERKIVYYSSNLFEFIKIPSIEKLILDIVYKTESFKDPNSVPNNILMDLDYLWDLIKYWVVYNYPTFNRINILKFEKRKAVVTIDTDSNMLNINRWMKYLDTKIDIAKTVTQDTNEIMYIKCNMLCYILTQYTKIVLAKYAKIANIPDKYAPRLNMKNEFLYLRMVLSDKKKRYTGLIRLREGNELIPEKLDCKGLDYMKSTCAKETKDYFMRMVHDDILYADNISGSLVLKHVKQFSDYIRNSLMTGEKRFLNPLSVKDPEAYANPFSNQGIRGSYTWNLLYPELEIQLPDKVTAVKVKLEKLSDLEELKTLEPDMYEKLLYGVFNNPKCPFSDKGVSVICIPSNIDRVPDWITHFIDIDKIVNDNISKIHPILKSLGLSLIDSRANTSHYSNIVVF